MIRPWTSPTRSGCEQRAPAGRPRSRRRRRRLPSSAPSSISGTTTNVRWPSGGLLADLLPRPVEIGRSLDAGPDRDPAGRRRSQVRHVEVRVEDLAERPRDRRRGHQQDVRRAAAGLRLERAALLDPEPMLLVDDRRGRGRANDTASWMSAWVPTTTSAWPDAIASSALALTSALSEPVSSVTPMPSALEQRAHRLEVLARQQVGRRQERALRARPGRSPPARRPRRRSCPIRRRPGAAAASASAGRGRRGAASMATTWSTVRSIALARRGPRSPRRSPIRIGRVGSASTRIDRRRVADALPPPLDHAELEREELVEGEPAQRRVATVERVRDSAPPRWLGRSAPGPPRAAIVVGQVLRVGMAGLVERLADRGPEARRGQPGRQRIDRHDPARVEQLRLAVVRRDLELGVVEASAVVRSA